MTPNRLTTVRDLIVPFLGCAVLSYLLFVSAYASIPSLHSFTAAPLFALAVGELAAAARVRGAVRHRVDAKPITAISVARLVALAKASALVGAGVVGAAVGALLRLVPDLGRLDAARGDSLAAALIGGASVVLVAAAWRLERSAVDPSRSP
jgi:Protein of unknown function (DUF3180)